MTLEEVKAWKTGDGKLFDSKEEANQYLSDKRFKDWCREELEPYIRSLDTEKIVEKVQEYWSITPKFEKWCEENLHRGMSNEEVAQRILDCWEVVRQ